jgi:hypothetical protein
MIGLFLGLWIALASALFAAPAAGLTLQMSAVHVGASNDCDCCSDVKYKPGDLCASMCANVLPVATLESDDLVCIAFHDEYALRRELIPAGRAISPDPPPPRSIAFR